MQGFNEITPAELREMQSGGNLRLIDVRSEAEAARGMIQGALHIPLQLLPPKEPPIKSHAVATVMQSGCRARREERRLVEAKPATNNNAVRTDCPVPSGCGKMRRLRRCASRLRSPGYDLRRASCIHPHFASNAIRGGLNQRFPKAGEWDSATPTVFYCQSGARSAQACTFFAGKGFSKLYHLQGGVNAWVRCGLPLTAYAAT
jgi:rhodanese-related sulfurtransferase